MSVVGQLGGPVHHLQGVCICIDLVVLKARRYFEQTNPSLLAILTHGPLVRIERSFGSFFQVRRPTSRHKFTVC